MKRIMTLLSIILILSACGSSNEKEVHSNTDNEVNIDNVEQVDDINLSDIDEFSDEYNSNIYDGGELDVDTEVDESGAQVIFTSDDYGIIAIYEDDVVHRYSIIFMGNDQSYKELEGNSIDAFVLIAKLFDMDTDDILNVLEKSFDKEKEVYFENDHTVMFFNHKLTGESQFDMAIEFIIEL